MIALECLVFSFLLAEPEEVLRLRGEAVRQAVASVSRSLVRLETTGGAERVGGFYRGAGPATGIVIDRDGWIVSSLFFFADKPSGIVARFTDGRRLPAKLVSIDRGRQLALLQVKASDAPAIDPSQIASLDTIRVGQTVVAAGWALPSELPSLSVGIVSALSRNWGKAIQTDAKTSPVNYGGPLLTLEGKLIGIVVLMSPISDETGAGIEWYDSGIGFAIPWTDIANALPDWKKKNRLPGRAGLSFAPDAGLLGNPTVAAVAPGSPASNAGIKKGDLLTEAGGRRITTVAGFRNAVGGLVAGDAIELAWMSDNQPRRARLTLVSELPKPKPAQSTPSKGAKAGPRSPSQ